MDYGFSPYLPDTLLDLQPFSSFAHYQEAQSRPARIVMRQRQRDFSANKCRMQQWLWDDMDSDMRLRVAYMCLCVAELHAVSGSPDLFQLTPELIQVMSTLPNLQPTLGFKRSGITSDTPTVGNTHGAAERELAAADPSFPADAGTSCAAHATDLTNEAVYTSNKQRKKAMQQVTSCAPLPLLASHEPVCRRKWRHGLVRIRTAQRLLRSWRGRKRPTRPMSSRRRLLHRHL
jgi:hypothetical protein